jgi:hypothetical protein
MNGGGVSMIVNKALIAVAVLLFTAPVVPALAHDDYGDRGYVRCLACPGSWRDHDGWRDRYRWRDYDRWRDHYRWRDHDGWRRHYGGWPYGGWRYGGWEY